MPRLPLLRPMLILSVSILGGCHQLKPVSEARPTSALRSGDSNASGLGVTVAPDGRTLVAANEKTPAVPSESDVIGVWKVPPEHAKRLNANPPNPNLYYAAPHSFRYDGKYITMALSNQKTWMCVPEGEEDDYCRVR